MASSERFTNAIKARTNGVFDDKDLMSFGPLGTEVEDVIRICRAFLDECGFLIGPRIAILNTNYPGRFMVLESPEDVTGPTEDGTNGPWCIVGDDLSELIATAFDFALDVYSRR